MFTSQIVGLLFSSFRRNAAQIERLTVSHTTRALPITQRPPLQWRAVFSASTFVFALSTVMAQIPGTLDTSFGSGTGKVVLPIGQRAELANATAIQQDGKILLAVSCRDINSNQVFCAARLNSDGTLDASFTGLSGSGTGTVLVPVGARNGAYATAIALQANGKIVLGGYCQDVIGNFDDFCVVRLNSDGSLDTTFRGGTGKVVQPIGAGYDRASALALQSDNKIIVAGTCTDTTGSNADFCVARLNVDGTLDASFVGPSGTSNGKFVLPVGTSDDILVGVAVQASDNKIVLLGRCYNGSPNFCVARLNNNGSLDASFVGPSGSGNGKFLLPIGKKSSDSAAAIAIQADGKIVLVGFCQGDVSNVFCVARLNVNGAFDTNFVGPNGTPEGKFLLPVAPVLPSSSDLATAVTLQLDGKIVVAGGCYTNNTVRTFNAFCVVRLNGDGTRDTSFVGTTGTGKLVLPIVSDNASVNGVVMQQDGKVVLAGYCSTRPLANDLNFCVARLIGGPVSVAGCSLDLDGDGLTTATVDGLIATRVMLGLRGPTVIAGITFPVNATRNSWPAISQYLVSQCGLNVY